VPGRLTLPRELLRSLLGWRGTGERPVLAHLPFGSLRSRPAAPQSLDTSTVICACRLESAKNGRSRRITCLKNVRDGRLVIGRRNARSRFRDSPPWYCVFQVISRSYPNWFRASKPVATSASNPRALMTSAASPAPHGLSLIASWDDGHGNADEERPEGCRQPAVQRAARSRPLVFRHHRHPPCFELQQLVERVIDLVDQSMS
jgi:hypothetical protein